MRHLHLMSHFLLLLFLIATSLPDVRFSLMASLPSSCLLHLNGLHLQLFFPVTHDCESHSHCLSMQHLHLASFWTIPSQKVHSRWTFLVTTHNIIAIHLATLIHITTLLTQIDHVGTVPTLCGEPAMESFGEMVDAAQAQCSTPVTTDTQCGQCQFR